VLLQPQADLHAHPILDLRLLQAHLSRDVHEHPEALSGEEKQQESRGPRSRDN
jgi:hypothetical protein